MTAKQYAFCMNEMTNYTDPTAFVSDLALSSVWGDDETAEIPSERVGELFSLWVAAHRSIDEVAALVGKTPRYLAQDFNIPLRSAHHWAAGEREAPGYVLMMIQECLGVLGFKIER